MQNYYLPPEWAPQSGVMLTWPHADSDWAPLLQEVEQVFVNIAKNIAPYEKVLITCFDQAHCEHISQLLQNAHVSLSALQLHIAPSDDTWVRDHGPITVLAQNQPLLLNFKFNAWGGKYSANRDDQITTLLHQQKAFAATPIETINLILEGGSIETDGQGTLLTTTRCLLADTRNKNITRDELLKTLQPLFGIQRILWLENGYLAGDDTDSHIDTLARFTDAHTICYVQCDDPNDTHYPALKTMEQELKAFKDFQGNPYQLVPLPWPKSINNKEGKRLPATYANFLIINNAVLVPVYNDQVDEKALQQIQRCFADRKIIGIRCETLIEQFGSLHCVTMQLPAGVLV